MELEDITTYVNGASEEELKGIVTMGNWIMEMGPKYCDCPSQCIKTCKIVQELTKAIETAVQKVS